MSALSAEGGYLEFKGLNLLVIARFVCAVTNLRSLLTELVYSVRTSRSQVPICKVGITSK